MNLGKRANLLLEKEGQEEACKKFLERPTFYGKEAVEFATFQIDNIVNKVEFIERKIINADSLWVKNNKTKILSVWSHLSFTQEQKIEGIWNS